MHIIIGLVVLCILIALLSKYWAILLFAAIAGGFAYYVYKKNSVENSRPTPDDERLYLTLKDNTTDPLYPSNYIYEFWTSDILCSSATRSRLARAKAEDLEIKSINNYGVAFVKGSTGNIYKTSLHSCTCKDFENNKKPCKHILKFALYTGALDKEDQLFGIPEEIEQRLQSLTKKARRVFMNYCNGDASEHVITRSIDIDKLLKSGLLIESVNPSLIIDKMYSFDTLKSILRSGDFSDLCIKCTRKADLIQRIINAGDACLNMFISPYAIVQIDPELLPYVNSIYDKYSEE